MKPSRRSRLDSKVLPGAPASLIVQGVRHLPVVFEPEAA